MSDLLDKARQLHSDGQINEAVMIYEQLLAQQNNDVDIRILYGLALAQQQRYQQAIDILTLLPEQYLNQDILNAIGISFHQQGRAQEAIPWLEKAIRIGPHPVSFNRLAIILIETGRYSEAEKLARLCITHFPNFFSAYTTLAITQNKQDQADNALLTLKELENKLGQSSPEIEVNRANALRQLGRDTEAATILLQLTAAGSINSKILNNLGHCLLKMGELAQAEHYFLQAAKLSPDDATAQWNIALLHLLQGDLGSGWRGYHYGKQHGIRPQLSYPDKKWHGRSLHDLKVLVVNEQGLGEEILFSAFFSLLVDDCQSLNVVCDGRLVELFSLSYPNITFYPHEKLDSLVSQHDVVCLAGDLPAMYWKDSLSSNIPKPMLKTTDLIQDKPFNDTDGVKRVGISWRGGKNKEEQKYRSIQLEQLLKHINPAHTLVPLQHDIREDEVHLLSETKHSVELTKIDLRKDLSGLARVIDTLDYVITVDNSIAHLSAAIQKDTRVLLPKTPYWIWGLDTQTPWYPSARLYRQQHAYDWHAVLTQLENEC